MANTIEKFLTYNGLAKVVERTASAITGVAATDNITLSLHGKETVNNKVVLTNAISDVIIPLANTETGLAGLMSAAQAQKLNSVTNNAEENQNAYSNFDIWKKESSSTKDVTLSAASKTDTLIIKAGKNIELSTEGTNILTIANTYTYTHPHDFTPFGPFDFDNNPIFGGSFNIIDNITTNDNGHVTNVSTGSITIPGLPNVTVTDKGNTTAANAGNTIVEVVKAVSNGTRPGNISDETYNNNIYLDFTTVEVPTKGYVDSAIEAGIAASDAMVLKGAYSGRSTGEWANTTTFSQGDTFVSTVSVEDTTLGKLEAGDLIIAKKDSASKSTATDWIVVQKNVDVYNGTVTGLVPVGDGTSNESKYLNQKGNWTVPAHLGIKANGTDIYGTTATGTVNLTAGTNLTITKGDANNGVTPITFAVDMTNIAEKGHKHTITANGTGDSWISVTPTSGELGVTYALSHGSPVAAGASTYKASEVEATDISNLAMGTGLVVTGVKYDAKGHIVGVTSGKLPADQKGVTSVTITQGTGITVSDSGKPITESGTRTISLNTAAQGQLGGIALGYEENANNFAVKLDADKKAYVTIPEISESEIDALFNITA